MNGQPLRVITAHGLWMRGVESGMLRRRLRRDYGFAPEQFRYRTVRNSLSENAARLRAYVSTLPDRRVHFIGHSLGGIVILKMLSDWPEAPVGRVVCLGSPIGGSRSAEGVCRLPGARRLLGRCIAEALLGEIPDWSGALGHIQVGVIAGTLGMGLGRFFSDLPKPNDGTVALAETRHPMLTDHLIVPSSHTGLVVSPAVAAQAAWFLNHGSFRRD